MSHQVAKKSGVDQKPDDLHWFAGYSGIGGPGEGAAGSMPVQYRWSKRECKVVPKVASQVGLQL